jgi:hypothetical protein
MKYASLFDRLVANSVKPDDQNENGCWVWTGRTDGKRYPYGRMNVRVEGKHTTTAPHCEMEKLFREDGLLCPETETIDHLCFNTLCINPDHWQIKTRAENSKISQERNPRLPTKPRA